MKNLLLLSLVMMPFSLSSSEFIRIQCCDPSLSMIFDLSDQLKAHGLLLVDDNPDALLCTEVSIEHLNGSCPIILYEKNASPSPLPETVKLLKHPNVIALIKNATFRDSALYQQSTVMGSYHWKLFSEAARLSGVKNQTDLSPAEARKIHCLPFYHSNAFSTMFDELRKVEVDFDQARPIDVFFAGKLLLKPGKEAKLDMFSRHRKAAIDVIKGVKDIKSFTMDSNKPLPYHVYTEIMKLSKIVVSPWGDNPWCFRDCEALYMGAVLVKPDTSFLRCYPDIFQNNIYYVPCSPSFSNLEKIIHNILARYDDYKSMRKRAKYLMDTMSRDQLAREFVLNIREILYENGNSKNTARYHSPYPPSDSTSPSNPAEEIS